MVAVGIGAAAGAAQIQNHNRHQLRSKTAAAIAGTVAANRVCPGPTTATGPTKKMAGAKPLGHAIPLHAVSWHAVFHHTCFHHMEPHTTPFACNLRGSGLALDTREVARRLRESRCNPLRRILADLLGEVRVGAPTFMATVLLCSAVAVTVTLVWVGWAVMRVLL